QLAPQSIDDAAVVACFILPEQANGRIPRAVITTQQPAPVRQVGQQNPGRPPERAGEMSDAGVDCDHEIKTIDQRRGLGEIGKMRTYIDDASLFEQSLVIRLRVLLKTDEGSVEVEQTQIHLQRDRPVAVVQMFGIAGPNEADPQFPGRAEAGKPILPLLHASFRWPWQIANTERNRLRARFKC